MIQPTTEMKASIGAGLRGHVGGLPLGAEAHARIVGQRLLEPLESVGVGETHEGHVPGVAAPVHLLEDPGVRPDLRFGDAASRGEPTDHLPGGPPHIDPVAHEQTLEGARGAVADDDLVPARLEVPPLHDFDLVAQREGRGFHAPERDVRVGSHPYLLAVDDDEEFRRNQRTVRAPRHPRSLPENLDVLMVQDARRFTDGTAPEHHRHIVPGLAGHHRTESGGHREHGDEDPDNPGDSEDRDHRNRAALPDGLQVVAGDRLALP